MEINIKLMVDMKEYGLSESPADAQMLALEMLRANADWPQFAEISVTRDPYRTVRYDIYASKD